MTRPRLDPDLYRRRNALLHLCLASLLLVSLLGMASFKMVSSPGAFSASSKTSHSMKKKTSSFPLALRPSRITVLAYGALLSESSSRLTFPRLENFRHVRVEDGLRRVFGHPHLFLVGRGAVDPRATLRLASLSAEPWERWGGGMTDADGKKDGWQGGFIAAAFEVDLDDEQREAFVAREPEYDISTARYKELGEGSGREGEGVICLAGSDDSSLTSISVPPSLPPSRGVWNWPADSGLLPADVYLRHCLLAVKKAGGEAERSFLEETYLADRKTTLGEYLEGEGERVMSAKPPEDLAARFGG